MATHFTMSLCSDHQGEHLPGPANTTRRSWVYESYADFLLQRDETVFIGGVAFYVKNSAVVLGDPPESLLGDYALIELKDLYIDPKITPPLDFTSWWGNSATWFAERDGSIEDHLTRHGWTPYAQKIRERMGG